MTRSTSSILLLLPISVVLGLSTGCSVFMAASGKREPNMGMIGIGAYRSGVELQLGSPESSVASEDSPYRTDTYEYELGNEPSAGRAVAHGVMDLLTLGLWEIIGTPVEAFQGKKHRIVITYNKQDRVVGINRPPYRAFAPAQQMPKAIGGTKVKRIEDEELRTESPGKWARIGVGLSTQQVLAILGEPQSKSFSYSTRLWIYPNRGFVRFKKGKVSGLAAPTI